MACNDVSTKRIISTSIIVLMGLSGFVVQSPLLGLAIIILSILLFNSPKYLIAPLLVSSFLDEICFLIAGITASRFFSLYIIVVLLAQNRNSLIFSKRITIFSIITVSYVFVSSILSKAGISDSTVTMILNIAMVFLLSRLSIKESDYVEIIKESCFGGLFIMLLMLYMHLGGAVVRKSGAYILMPGANNNTAAMILAQIGAMFLGYYLIEKQRYSRFPIYTIGSIILSFVLLFLTGSRSASFGLIIATFFTLIIDSKWENKPFISMLKPLVIGGIGYVIYEIMMTNYSLLASRFSVQEILQSNGTGRFEIWNTVWNNIIKRHWFLGIGFGGENVQIALNTTNLLHKSGTHNLFLDMLAQMGIVGTSYFFFWFYRLMRYVLRVINDHKTIVCFLLMCISALANGIGENIFSERYLWIVIGLLVSYENIILDTEGEYNEF